MNVSARILALWLSPALCLTLPALILVRGSDALWVGLLVVLAPLLALSFRVPPQGSGPSLLRGRIAPFAFAAMAGMLLSANLTLVGDMAAAGGMPRWQGIVLAAAGLWLLTLSARAPRAAAALLVLAAAGLGLSLVLVVRISGSDPLEAWSGVASQPAFRFASSSPAVTEGRSLPVASSRDGLVFDEEHRVGVAEPATLRARTREGGATVQREWMLAAGQWVTFRPGDALTAPAGAVMRFEAGKRVPGAPSSGPAWALGGQGDWAVYLGLAATLLGGGVSVVGWAGAHRMSRTHVATLALGLLMALAWAQGWAVYGALAAPDLFLGGPSAVRMLDLPALALGRGPLATALATLSPVGVLAAFLASGAALRTSLAAAWPGEARSGVAWTAVLGVAALASAGPLDPWAWLLLALGFGASMLAPPMILSAPARHPETASGAALIGLAVFLALGGAGLAHGPMDGLLGVAFAYPAVLAGPSALAVLWLARR